MSGFGRRHLSKRQGAILVLQPQIAITYQNTQAIDGTQALHFVASSEEDSSKRKIHTASCRARAYPAGAR
jgi:hypothetical protein